MIHKSDIVRTFYDLSAEVKRHPQKYFEAVKEILTLCRNHLHLPGLFGGSYPSALLSIFKQHPLSDHYHTQVGIDENTWDGLGFNPHHVRGNLEKMLLSGTYVGFIGPSFHGIVRQHMGKHSITSRQQNSDDIRLYEVQIPDEEYVWLGVEGQPDEQHPPLWLIYSEVIKGSNVVMPKRIWTSGTKIYE